MLQRTPHRAQGLVADLCPVHVLKAKRSPGSFHDEVKATMAAYPEQAGLSPPAPPQGFGAGPA
eukprot:12371783-Karenia_brevis.AAC.1